MARLILQDDGGRVSQFELSHNAVIGRSRSCSVRIKDKRISREHSKIVFKEGRFLVFDAGSKNGTKVNGRLATEPVPLRSGDRIDLGDVVLTFTEDAAPGAEHRSASADPAAAPLPMGRFVTRVLAATFIAAFFVVVVLVSRLIFSKLFTQS